MPTFVLSPKDVAVLNVSGEKAALGGSFLDFFLSQEVWGFWLILIHYIECIIQLSGEQIVLRRSCKW